MKELESVGKLNGYAFKNVFHKSANKYVVMYFHVEVCVLAYITRVLTRESYSEVSCNALADISVNFLFSKYTSSNQVLPCQ